MSTFILNGTDLKELWAVTTKEENASVIKIYKDKLYVLAGDYIENGLPSRHLFCFSKDKGKKIWHINLKDIFDGPVFYDNKLYVWAGLSRGKVYAITTDKGKIVWEFNQDENYSFVSYNIDYDKGLIFLEDDKSKFYTLDMKTGKLLVSDSLYTTTTNDLLINEQKEFIINDKKISCYVDRNLVWEKEFSSRLVKPSLDNKNVYFVNYKERSIYALSQDDGHIIWKFYVKVIPNVKEPNEINFSYIATHENLYIAQYDGTVICAGK